MAACGAQFDGSCVSYTVKVQSKPPNNQAILINLTITQQMRHVLLSTQAVAFFHYINLSLSYLSIQKSGRLVSVG